MTVWKIVPDTVNFSRPQAYTYTHTDTYKKTEEK